MKYEELAKVTMDNLWESYKNENHKINAVSFFLYIRMTEVILFGLLSITQAINNGISSERKRRNQASS